MPQITSYSAIETVEPTDVIPIVDVSDQTMSPTGTTKKVTVSQLAGGGGTGGSGYALLSGAEFTGYVAPAVVYLSYASTITINAPAGNSFRVTLTGNPTLANPVSPAEGQQIEFWLTQDSTGSRTVTWGGAFNFGGGSPPTLSTAAGATDVVGFSWNANLGIWKFLGSTTGGGAAGIGVTLSGTPAAGLAPIATSGTAAEWLAPFGTRPEWFGTVTGTSGDQAALNAAITAINAGTSPSPLVLTRQYAIDSTVTLLTGVDVVCSGQGNRQVGLPDGFTGGVICPSTLFPTGSATPLLAIGTSGDATTNPNGITLDGLCLNGVVGGTGSTYATNCQGLLVTDTADVHVTNAYLANFDRPGGTGCAIYLTSGTAGNGVGFTLNHSVISASQKGLYTTGAGVTDLRMAGNLWHSNTQAISLGTSGTGGGGYQITNDHATYSGMPSGGWHLATGGQAGDFLLSNVYFDQAGSTVCVQLGNDKGVCSGCHWLATSTSTAVSLVAVTISAPAEMVFTGNNANLNGSSVTALLQTSAHAGIPSGVWFNNWCYGTGGSFIAPLIDSASAVIPQITQPPGGTSNYLRADGTWQNPSVATGTVSGAYVATPVQYAPGSLTALTVSSATMSAFSSSNVNTGSFLAPASGTVVVTVSCVITMATANQNFSLGLAAHGTTSPLLSNVVTVETSSAAQKLPYQFTFIVGSLTPSSSYSLDLVGAIATGSVTIQALGSTSTTPTGTIGGPVTLITQAV